MNVLPRRWHVSEPVDHDEFYEVECAVRRLFAMVVDAIDVATTAFLGGDVDAATAVAERDGVIDELQRGLERRVVDRLARRADLAPRQVRELLAVLRVVPELERSGDLCDHIAARARGGLGSRLSSEARVVVQQMGWHATAMWRDAATAYVERDATMIVELTAADAFQDDLHGRLTGTVAQDRLAPDDAMELGLIARFFERLGDHAVNITRRLEDLASVPAAARP